jgi:hypothetical protein
VIRDAVHKDLTSESDDDAADRVDNVEQIIVLIDLLYLLYLIGGNLCGYLL